MTTLKELFTNKIKALYDIESELIKNLPELSEAASDEKLRAGFDEHLEETKEQKRRLEEIFTMLEEEPEPLECEAIRGLAEDAAWVIENVEEGSARDLNLIAASSFVEHYEMAGYMAAIEWAKALEMDDAAKLLEETLGEEEAVDKKMMKLSKDIIKNLEE